MALKHKELETWLQSLPLSDSLKKSLEEELGADEQKQVKVRETVLARSDYSRNMDALRDERQKLEADVQRANAEAKALIDANTKWKTDNEGVLSKAVRKAEKMQSKLDAYNKKMAGLAAQGLIDPDDLDVDIPPDQPPSGGGNSAPARDPQTGQFVTRDEWLKLREKEDGEKVRAMAYLDDKMDEIQHLFGTRPKRLEVLEGLAKTGKNLDQYLEDTYKVKDKREQLAKEDEDKRFGERLAAEKTKWISEHSIPSGGGATVVPGGLAKGHILSQLPKQEGMKPNVSPTVQAASEHWRQLRLEGKVS